ncbi:hypothetical protein SAY87_010153 [Trapa incisa]|uniref:Teneurin NHL domain-containing protein n=1 Tax=Trapa incisa TaxID=236973 RepID=A0AAN7JAP1_9MYRT|nr:hypothetical protein SAY87_010153 [Trapa incisa]
MNRTWVVLLLVSCVLLRGASSSSTFPAAKVISSAAANVVSALVKWLWSLQSTPKTEVSSRSMMKFEAGYTVETVLDGSKLGIEPYSIEVSGDGELLVLDSHNSNIYKTSILLSRHSRPKLVVGSREGYSGHVDGRTREARLNHPKGLAVDDRGNIYIADAVNMAIRKISDSGISTIAGGKWGRGGGHLDGPSEDAKFSNDFDVFYISITCSLLVVDRGNQAIREIQLHHDDCSHEDSGSFHHGMAVLIAAGFFGYMLALLQQRVRAMFSSKDDMRASIVRKGPSTKAPYQMPHISVRPHLIPSQDDNETEVSDDGLFHSAAKLIINTGSSMAEIIVGLLTIFSGRKKPSRLSYPVQETFLIHDEDASPLEPQCRAPPLKRSYPFMTTYDEVERNGNYSGQIHPSNYRRPHHEQHQQQPVAHQIQQHHQRHAPSDTQTYYEKSCETKEVVFGAIQEQDGGREAMVIKAVDYGDPIYNHHSIRSRINYTGYSNRY